MRNKRIKQNTETQGDAEKGTLYLPWNLSTRLNIFRKQRGITLLTLIITIVVLLTLSGITIGMITGKNGIVKNAQMAKDEAEISMIEEEVHTLWLEVLQENMRYNRSPKELGELLGGKLGEEDLDATVTYKEEEEIYEVFYKGHDMELDADGSIRKSGSGKKIITLNRSDYKGIYDGEEHTITLEVTKPSSGTTIYYSTSTSLTLSNYNTSGSTEKPVRTEIGTTTVYWYIKSNDSEYGDRRGRNSIIINDKNNNNDDNDDKNPDVVAPSNPPLVDSNISFATAYGTIDVIWLSGTTNTVSETPNSPVLTSNGESMTPVTWTYNEPTSAWYEDSSAQTSWYSYNSVSSRNDDGSTVDNLTSNWANAKTANGSYFVWIPRYAYRITYYSSETSTKPTGYYDGYGMWDATYGITKYKLDDGIETVEHNGKKYIVHPAFETDLDNGGWDTDLTGFWFAKYLISGSSTALTSVPNASGLGSATIGKQYLDSRKATYGYTGTSDTITSNGTNYTYTSYMHSHLVKNSEWGAVAYLTQSQYGRNGNEIDMNNGNTGNGGGAVSGETTTGTSYAYNTATGSKASTTGNVYGIYDMSGGFSESIAAYNKVGHTMYLTDSKYGSAMALQAKDSRGNYISTKYITAYSNDSVGHGDNIYTVGKVGDATKEVYVGEVGSNNYVGWFSDSSIYIGNSNNAFFGRGGPTHRGELCRGILYVHKCW